MKQHRYPIIALITLIIVSLACGLFGGGEESEKSAPGVDAPKEEKEEVAVPEYEPGYEPGWRIFSNANFVNGIAVYDGVLWAATEGGVVAWDLASDQAVKYTPLDGLGHLSTYDVVVCPMPEPTVVVATDTGLSLYDIGSGTWNNTPITPADSYVATSSIDKLFCDEENGRLLVGYRGLGILEISNGAWQRYLEEDGLAWNGVDGITVVGTDVWTVGYKGISVISEQGIKLYNEETGMPDETSDAIETDSDGTVWVASSGGLVRFIGDNMSVFNRDNTEGMSGSLDALTVASDGTVWTATSSGSICQFDPAQESCVYTYEGDNSHYLSDMAAGDNGDVYYSTYGGGIWAYNGSEWRNLFIEEDQLASNFVYAIFEDPDGMLWVGTDKGLQTFDPGDIYSTWTTYKAGEGKMPSNKVKSIQVSPSGEMWFTHDSYVSSFNGSSWTRYGEDEGVSGSVFAMAFDKDGIPYIGTEKGLVILGDGSYTLLTDADGLPSARVLSLLYDGETMWIGTTDGLARFDGTGVEVVLDNSWEGLPNDAILSIVEDQDGNLLLGTPEGLAQYDGAKVTTLLEPLAVSGGIFGEQIQSISGIATAKDGSLWITTYGGLYHGDGKKWETFTTTEGLPTNNLYTVLVDSTGVIWVGGGYTNSGGGITRIIPGETKGTSTGIGDADSEETSEPGQAASGSSDSGSVKYDQNTGLPLYKDAEQIYSTDSVLNYWSSADFSSLRAFYLTEMPKIGWQLDVDENGNCRDDNRCMGWHSDYSDPENQTFFFLKGEKGYITLNLIPEDNQVNVIFAVNEPAE